MPSTRFSTIPWVLLLVCVGCNSGPPRQHLRGTVSLDGQPIDAGTIEFIPTDDTGGPSLGSAIVDGAFHVPQEKGPRAGAKYKVVITANRPSGRTVPNIFEPGGAPLPISEQYLPARYNIATELTVTISAEDPQNEHAFELHSDGS